MAKKRTAKKAKAKPRAAGKASKKAKTRNRTATPTRLSAKEKARCQRIFKKLHELYPSARTALLHHNPFQLMVATILSAQCTDVRVNMVTPDLFKVYPDAQSMARAPQAKLEEIIRSTGFFRNKAKSIRGASARIVEHFDGKVPDTMDELLTLPGVARKTANCVLGNAFAKNEGVVVDTHVARLSKRMGLSKFKDPVKIERDLMARFPRDGWTLLSHMLIDHGRAICPARKPKCDQCPLAGDCAKIGV